jgi:hypothetical protein
MQLPFFLQKTNDPSGIGCWVPAVFEWTKTDEQPHKTINQTTHNALAIPSACFPSLVD